MEVNSFSSSCFNDHRDDATSYSDDETAPSTTVDATEVVRLFLEHCAQGNYAQARTLLDTQVQVSYPGLPFLKSSKQWYHQVTKTAAGRDAWGRGHHQRWAEAPQPGCCPGQVIRRCCKSHKSSSSNGGGGGGFIEVFCVSQDDDNSNNNQGGSSPRIMAMYLRRAPSKWMTMSSSSSSNSSPSRSHRFKKQKLFRESRCDVDDIVQERLRIVDERVREERLSFMLRKGNFVY